MVKVLPAIFSYEDMKERFAQDNPDDPYTRRADLESGIYALDSWLIRVDDDNKAISTVGFKENPSHTVVGGMYATAKGRQIGGNNRALQDAREPQLNPSKPLVAAFGHREGDNSRWIANAKKNGWSFPDSPNWEQMSQLLPPDVLNAWLSRYPEKMAIRSIRGEGEFAKCIYLDDPTPAWFNVLKSKKGGWKDILKVLPPSDWTPYPYREIDPESNNKTPREINIGDTKYVASGHYITAVYGRNNHGTSNRNTTDFEKWVNCVKGLGKGKYWMYVNDSPTQRHIILIDIINQGDRFPGSSEGKVVNINTTNDEGKPVKKVVIFRNYFNKMPSEIMQRKRVDCYAGIKLKEGHEKYSKGRSIEISQQEEEEQQTEPTTQVSSGPSPRERARKEIEKIVGKVNWSLPKGHIKPIIDEKVKELENAWPRLRRKEKQKIYRNLKEAY